MPPQREKGRLFHRLRARAEAIVRDIREGEPGDRFYRYWRMRQGENRSHPFRRVLLIVLGVFLVIAGIILGPTPIIPGFVVGIPGLAILAAQLRFLSKLLDKGELLLRRLFRFQPK